MSSLTAARRRRDDGSTEVRLSGAIDEKADLRGIFAELDGPVIFDLGGVDRINSIGVLAWVNEIGPYTDRFPVSVEAASYPIVLQANTVANFFGAASVASCLAPYFCGQCNTNHMVSVAAGELAGRPPTKLCADCGAELEFDELDNYLDLLKPRS